MLLFTNKETGKQEYICIECKVDKGKRLYESEKKINADSYK